MIKTADSRSSPATSVAGGGSHANYRQRISMQYTLNGPASAPVVTLSHSLARISPCGSASERPGRPVSVLRYDTRGTAEPMRPASLLARSIGGGCGGAPFASGDRADALRGAVHGWDDRQVLALKHSEMLRSLVLCDTRARFRRMRSRCGRSDPGNGNPGMEPHVEPTLGRWFTPSYIEGHPDVLERVRTMIGRRSHRVHRLLSRDQGLDLTDRLSAIAVPTLIVVGEDDTGPRWRRLAPFTSGSRGLRSSS